MDYLSRIQRIIGTSLMLAITSTGLAQDSKETVLQYIDDNASLYGEVAQQIWDWAEVGYLETQSSNLLQQQLVTAGFEVTNGVAGIPTAFVATWRRAGRRNHKFYVSTGSSIIGSAYGRCC